MKLEHFAINVDDAANMAQWYVENLGFTIVSGISGPPHTHFLADDDKESVIEIYSNPAAEAPDYGAIPPLNLHIAFETADIEADRTRLLAAGATAEGEIYSTAAGDQLVFLRDPWKIPLQLVKRNKPLI